jgi:type IV secretion system protein VirB2
VRLERTLQAAVDAAASPRFLRTAAVAGVLLFAAGRALAANSGGDPMPWEGPMDRFLAFFTGPFVRIAAIIAIVLLGVGMAFSENGTGMRKMVTAFFGIALAFGAATWGLTFFGFTGGADVGGQYLPVEEPAAVVITSVETAADSVVREAAE